MIRFNESWKLFEEKKKNESLSKRFLITLPDNVNIYLVNGEALRNTIETDWIGGGHYYVPYKFIPENEIWIEKLSEGERELEDILIHEIVERKLMKYKKYNYDEAHKVATEYEKMYRMNEKNESHRISDVFDKFFNTYFKNSEYTKNNFSEKLEKSIIDIKL